jgi:hypothetical protein
VRDVEVDLRHRLSREAVTSVVVLRRGTTTVDATLDYLVSGAYGSSDRLTDARDLLGQQDIEARALLNRAARRAADPQPATHPRPFFPPDTPR